MDGKGENSAPGRDGDSGPERSIRAGIIGAAISGDVGKITINSPASPPPPPRGGPPRRNPRRIRLTAVALGCVCAIIAAVALVYPRSGSSAYPPASSVPPPPPGTAAPSHLSHSAITVSVHSDGQDEYHGLNEQGQGLYSYQINGPLWSPWAPFGPGGSAVAIAVAADSGKMLHILLVMADGSIREQSENTLNHWGNWQSFAPVGTAKDIALGRDRLGDLEAYAVTPRGTLISRKQVAPDSGSWGGWETAQLSGTVQSVAALQQVAGYLQVMAVMTDGSVEWEGERQTGWGPWNQLGPPGTAVEVSAGQNADGGLAVFALTPTGTISNRYQQDDPGFPWSSWTPVSGLPCTATSIFVASPAPQLLAVVAVCTDGTLRYSREAKPNGDLSGKWSIQPGAKGVFGSASPVRDLP